MIFFIHLDRSVSQWAYNTLDTHKCQTIILTLLVVVISSRHSHRIHHSRCHIRHSHRRSRHYSRGIRGQRSDPFPARRRDTRFRFRLPRVPPLYSLQSAAGRFGRGQRRHSIYKKCRIVGLFPVMAPINDIFA